MNKYHTYYNRFIFPCLFHLIRGPHNVYPTSNSPTHSYYLNNLFRNQKSWNNLFMKVRCWKVWYTNENIFFGAKNSSQWKSRLLISVWYSHSVSLSLTFLTSICIVPRVCIAYRPLSNYRKISRNVNFLYSLLIPI